MMVMSSFPRIFTISALAFLLIPSLLPNPEAAAQTQDYVIKKGDQLLVTVWGYNEFTGPTSVKDDGTATIPLVGEVKAAGLTKDEFIAGLRKRLSDYVKGEIKITVSVVSSAGQRVTILGAVARPDNYPVANEISLPELVAMAGGYTPDANLAEVRIIHRESGQPTTEVNMEMSLKAGDIESLPRVAPGDIVLVPRAQNFIREFSEFFRDVILFFTIFILADNAVH